MASSSWALPAIGDTARHGISDRVKNERNGNGATRKVSRQPKHLVVVEQQKGRERAGFYALGNLADTKGQLNYWTEGRWVEFGGAGARL